MYTAFFDLKARPFPAVPVAERYYAGGTIETARATLARCLLRGEGAGLVVGPTGTGKSLLCRVLAEQFAEQFPVAVLASGRLATRSALFQAILFELSRSYRGMDEGELRLALVDYLTTHEDCPQGLVLLVDEAQSLPLRLIDEIRMLTNVTRDGMPAVRLVLAGGCVLEERLASPKLDSFSQRLVARCYLEPFNRTETQQYVQSQVTSVGGVGTTLFPAEACQAVYQATDGVPRLINQVCDHALLLAYVAQRSPITSKIVEEAWADLQQLPTPWTAESEPNADNAVIEFGGLDDVVGDLTDGAEMPLEIETATDEFAKDDLAAIDCTADLRTPDEPMREPAAQLDHIETMLHEADSAYQSASSDVSDTTASENTPTEEKDPFAETFAEEEIITPRTRIHIAALPKRAAVDHDLSASEVAANDASEDDLCEEHVAVDDFVSAEDREDTYPSHLTQDERFESDGEPHHRTDEDLDRHCGVLDSPSADDTEAISAESDTSADDFALPTEEELLLSAGSEPEQVLIFETVSADNDDLLEDLSNDEPETVPMHFVSDSDDERVIIVDDDNYDERELVVAGPITAVRRREYGQLFAKLRRG